MQREELSKRYIDRTHNNKFPFREFLLPVFTLAFNCYCLFLPENNENSSTCEFTQESMKWKASSFFPCVRYQFESGHLWLLQVQRALTQKVSLSELQLKCFYYEIVHPVEEKLQQHGVLPQI